MSEKYKLRNKYSKRHIRRIVQASTDADLERLGANFSHLPEEVQGYSEILSTPDNDDHPHTIFIENEQRTVSPVQNLEYNSSIGCDLGSNSSVGSMTFDDAEVDVPVNDHVFESSETDNNTSQKFQQELASWAIEYNVPHNACNSLITIIRKFTDYNVPKDIRSILQTPKSINTKSIDGGSYCHFGLTRIIQKMISDSEKNPEYINLLLNIDGLPISKSSSASLWPILCSNDENERVYIIGVYYGLEKPRNCNEFLKPLVDELIILVNNGYCENGKFIRIRLHAIICDAPAKSFILCTKSHTGYYSCPTCTIEGRYYNNRVCFPKPTRNPTIRTDEKFSRNLYEDYQIGYTILNSVPHVGLVTNVPGDYLHIVCFCGVKKSILLCLKHGPLSVRLSTQSVKKISDLLIKLRDTVPNNFVRRPRALTEIHFWKATEFRNFLLYTGPIVLKNILKDDVYHNFITLHVAIRILISPTLCKESNCIDYAEALLEHFVISFGKIYGQQYVSHNIHNLLHLSFYVRTYGPLDGFSAFRFENFMSSIKKLLRKSEKPLEQLARRYNEIEAIRSNSQTTKKSSSAEPHFSNLHSSGPLANFRGAQLQYKSMTSHMLNLNCNSSGDNCCILSSGECIVVKNIVTGSDANMYVIGNELKYEGDLYSLPCPSSKLDIKIVSDDNTTINYWPLSKIKSKAWKMPYKRHYVIVPIIHTI